MANSEKLNRRLAKGDKNPNAQTVSTDTTSGIPARPMPNMEQGKGNLENFRATDTNGQMGQNMGAGQKRYPYGDGGLSLADGRMGGIGFVENSGTQQNLIPGRGLNRDFYNGVAQPKEGMSQEMLLPQGLAKEATTRAQKLYAAGSGDNTPSYQVGPMGMLGTPVEVNIQGNVNPGQLPAQTPMQTNTTMSLSGNTTASLQQNGLNTGRGGGRNQKPNNA